MTSMALPTRAGRAAAGILAAAAVAALALAPVPAHAQFSTPSSFADLAENLIDAVVNISTRQKVSGDRAVEMPDLPKDSPFQEFFDEFFKRNQNQPQARRVSSLGSGFVIDASGIIVTNNHVIEDADEIVANFNDGSSLTATVIGHDTKTDVALLKVEPKAPLKAVSFGDSDRLRVGDWVMAIGNPFGLGGTVTVGIVSARDRDINSGPYDDFIQTDASINRGNSGGPLFDVHGNVVGVNTAIISPSGGSIGIGFAVPANTAVPVIGQLRQYGETRRGWLGVRIQEVTDEIAESLGLDSAHGALVAGVTPKGPAEAAGIQAGDIIVAFDGKDVPEMHDLPRIVADTEIGREVDVKLLRDRSFQNIKVTVARLEESDSETAAANTESEPQPQQPLIGSTLGMQLATLTDELRAKYGLPDDVDGVVIVEIEPTSAAAESGLAAGDVILEVAQEPVATPDDVGTRVEALTTGNADTSVLFLVRRHDGERRYVAVKPAS